MQTNELYLDTKPIKLFFKAALPGMISMFSMSVYVIIEGIFIGRILGATSFAAINLALPLVMINFALADLIGVGSSVPISIALGRQDGEEANNIFSSALILIFLAAALMGAVMYFASPAIFALMGAKGEAAELAVKYVRVCAVLGPFCSLTFAMDNYLRICGFLKTSMFINILSSVLTIGLLAVFILVYDLGVIGSALACNGAMFVCVIFALIPFLAKKTVLRFRKPKISFSLVKQIAACGSPTFLNTMAGRLASIIMNTVLIRLGGDRAVAIYGVLMYAGDLIQPFLYGMNDSLQPAIGYNWGAVRYDRVKGIIKCTFGASAVFCTVATVFVYIFSGPIASLFVEQGNMSLLNDSASALRLFCLTYLIRWVGFCAQSFFTAIEKPFEASVLSVSSAFVFPVIVMLVLWPMGLTGLWLNQAGTAVLMAFMAVIMLIRMQKKLKIKEKL